jgi:hypothetical protein
MGLAFLSLEGIGVPLPHARQILRHTPARSLERFHDRPMSFKSKEAQHLHVPGVYLFG